MRRVFLHLGFHKTGTTSAQTFLQENRKLIWPHHALILPKGAREIMLDKAAMDHSIYQTPGTLKTFDRTIRKVLATLNFGQHRGLILSEENLAGRRPSQIPAQMYCATPELTETLVRAVIDRFAPEPVDITIYFSIRQPVEWMKSLWAHDLRKTRLTEDFPTFRTRLEPGSDLLRVVDQTRDRLPKHRVITHTLEQMAPHQYGSAQPFLDFLDLPAHKAARLIRTPVRGKRPDETELLSLLELNRSTLDEPELIQLKSNTIRQANARTT